MKKKGIKINPEMNLARFSYGIETRKFQKNRNEIGGYRSNQMPGEIQSSFGKSTGRLTEQKLHQVKFAKNE